MTAWACSSPELRHVFGTAGLSRKHSHKIGTAPATYYQITGCFERWWQVLGSNQRRLSRRFYRPLPLATRATCRKPPSRDGTLKDSGTRPLRQHPGV